MGNNYLFCYKQNRTQKWEMVKEDDRSAFIRELLMKKGVDLHNAFFIPTFAVMGGIWLDPDTHKSSRLDFWKFFEEYGQKYKPDISDESRKFADKKAEELRQKEAEAEQRYGFISPDGRFYKCAYRGHYDLADRICFGMVETNNSEEYLEEHGWCKVYRPIDRNYEYGIYVGGNHEVTDAQMKTLSACGINRAEGMSDILCKDN